MIASPTRRFDFDAAPPTPEPEPAESLTLDLDGYEGPLDVLLALARSQKVDLLRLSVTRLVDQYLAFVREARRRRFALAADYLVMAAWLAYLKSRLLLPRAPAPPEVEPDAEAVARDLARRLVKLQMVRQAAAALEARPCLGRDVFPRGQARDATVASHHLAEGNAADLMMAYVAGRTGGADTSYRVPVMRVWRLDEARDHLRILIPALDRWTALDRVAPPGAADGPGRASMVASTLSAALECVRDGALDARQLAAFSSVYLRARKAGR